VGFAIEVHPAAGPGCAGKPVTPHQRRSSGISALLQQADAIQFYLHGAKILPASTEFTLIWQKQPASFRHRISKLMHSGLHQLR